MQAASSQLTLHGVSTGIFAIASSGPSPDARADSAPPVPLLAEYAATWLDSIRGLVRPRTYEGYAYRLERHILPRFGQRRLDEIGVDDILALIGELREGGYSGWSIRSILTPALAALLACRPPRCDRGQPDQQARPQRASGRMEARAEGPQQRGDRAPPRRRPAALPDVDRDRDLDRTAAERAAGAALAGHRFRRGAHPGTKRARPARQRRAAEDRTRGAGCRSSSPPSPPSCASIGRSRRSRALRTTSSPRGSGHRCTGATLHGAPSSRHWPRPASNRCAGTTSDTPSPACSSLAAQTSSSPRDSSATDRPDITLRVYSHLFDRAEQAQRTRDLLEATLGDAIRPRRTAAKHRRCLSARLAYQRLPVRRSRPSVAHGTLGAGGASPGSGVCETRGVVCLGRLPAWLLPCRV